MSRVLDVRGLPPCEPLERTLAALDELAPGDELEVLIHREPHPLYAILAERGFLWRAATEPAADGSTQYRILISLAE
jgi:uncharacterized protein (DUF2249 family)